MTMSNRQALIGGLVAAALTAGASTAGGQGMTATVSPLSASPASYVAEVLVACADKALAFALDVGGEAIARLKQL